MASAGLGWAGRGWEAQFPISKCHLSFVAGNTNTYSLQIPTVSPALQTPADIHQPVLQLLGRFVPKKAGGVLIKPFETLSVALFGRLRLVKRTSPTSKIRYGDAPNRGLPYGMDTNKTQEVLLLPGEILKNHEINNSGFHVL